MSDEGLIIGQGWMNTMRIRPSKTGTYLVAKKVGDKWAVRIADYFKPLEVFVDDASVAYSPLDKTIVVKGVEFWNFIPWLPEDKDND